MFNRAIRGQRWYRQPIREDVYAIGENPSNKRKEWLAALDSVESVKPRAVVAGHKRHGEADNPKIIRETKQYIRDFDRLAAETHTAEELYKQMLALYPDRVNPGALWSSARAVKH